MSTSNTTAETTITHTALVLGLSSLAMLCAVTLSAQDTVTTNSETSTTVDAGGDKGMEAAFGVKGGVNWSTLYVGEAKDVDLRLGGHFGFFARVAPTGGLGIQVEALYDQRGATFTRTYDMIDQRTTYKFDYISVPILITIPLGSILELQGGGYLAALIVSERKFEGDVANFTNDLGDGKFQSFDYGLCGGVALNLERVQFGARYNHGLNKLANSPDTQFLLGNSMNASFQAYLALALGKRSQ